jgi:DNA primase large subunit
MATNLPRELSFTFPRRLTVDGIVYPSPNVALKMIADEETKEIQDEINNVEKMLEILKAEKDKQISKLVDKVLRAKFEDVELANILLETPTQDLPSEHLVRIKDELATEMAQEG